MLRAVVILYFVLLSQVFGQTTPTLTGAITASAFGGFAAAAPGSFVELYGVGLSATTRLWGPNDFVDGNPPTSLDRVTVTVAGAAAYIAYVSPSQVNIVVPAGIPTGPAPVVLSAETRASAAFTLQINAVQPGFYTPDRRYIGAIHSATGTPVTTAAPAFPGEILLLFGTGFGPAPISLTLTFGGRNAVLQYSGVAPGLVGLSQFNVVVPANLPPGDQPMQAVLGGTVLTSQTLLLAGPAGGGGGAPGPPTNVAATAGDGSASIAFRAPNGPATFTVTCTGDGAVVRATGAASPINVTGLTNGTTYSCAVTASNGSGTSAPSASVTVTPTGAPSSGGFVLTSTAGADGGTLPSDYTCDGMGSTIQLAWANAPAFTAEFALLMTTLPGDGTTKWNWVLYSIPATTSNLLRDSFLVGTMGTGSDGPGQVYNPPCSQGPGLKLYTYTLYALAAAPSFTVPAAQVTGQMVTDAIASITLAKASLTLGATRTAAATGSSTACGLIRTSTRASKSGQASVSCDETYAYVGSNGITTQPMMNGITSTNLQVPIPVNFNGANAWKIPLKPVLAAKPTDVVDGPLGVAINGVPIFNPCTQGGCITGGDTKALGQLDTCNGHAGRADDYHYHAAPVCMMADQPPNYWDTHPLGWALDGFAIFGFNDADGSVAARDAVCGGNTKTVPNAPAGYSYHVTNASPYITNCLAGVPSPDLPNQGSKYRPMRQPPVVPFNNSGMTLTTEPDGYQVLQFTSAIRFTTNETGSDSYVNAPGTYKIRYKQLLGAELVTALAAQRAGATACWNFQFLNSSGATTQPTVNYCK